MSKIKHKSTKSLRKILWKLVSEYVRRSASDGNGIATCYTCGKRGRWETMHCGHYIHRDCLDYEADFNLRCQCPRCNLYLSGNSGVFAEKLIAEIGAEEVSLLRQRSKQVKKWTVLELEEMILTYKQALGTLSGEVSK